MITLLLDGSKMEAKEFYKRYDEYVGMPHNDWEQLPTTKFEGTSETYEYRDDKFAMGGSVYSEPKLYALEAKSILNVLEEKEHCCACDPEAVCGVEHQITYCETHIVRGVE